MYDNILLHKAWFLPLFLTAVGFLSTIEGLLQPVSSSSWPPLPRLLLPLHLIIRRGWFVLPSDSKMPRFEGVGSRREDLVIVLRGEGWEALIVKVYGWVPPFTRSSVWRGGFLQLKGEASSFIKPAHAEGWVNFNGL